MIMLKMLLTIYLFGVGVTLLLGFVVISSHITIRGIITTIIMSLFSWFALWHIAFGGGGKTMKL